MTLEEAIEIKETELDGSVEHSEEELRKADKLGIEAMKKIIAQRKRSDFGGIPKLSGETLD